MGGAFFKIRMLQINLFKKRLSLLFVLTTSFYQMSYAIQQGPSLTYTIQRPADTIKSISASEIWKAVNTSNQEIDTLEILKLPNTGIIKHEGSVLQKGDSINFSSNDIIFQNEYQIINDSIQILIEDRGEIADSLVTIYFKSNRENFLVFLKDSSIQSIEDESLQISSQIFSQNIEPSVSLDSIVVDNISISQSLFFIQGNDTIYYKEGDTIRLAEALYFLPKPNSTETLTISWHPLPYQYDQLSKVLIEITPVNDVPILGELVRQSTQEDIGLNINEVDWANIYEDVEDEYPHFFKLLSLPDNGHIISGAVDTDTLQVDEVISTEGLSNWIYQPKENFNGEDNFTFALGDSESAFSNSGQFYIDINPVNDAPSIIEMDSLNDYTFTRDSSEVTFSWGRASDPENDSVYYKLIFESAVESKIFETGNTSISINNFNEFIFDAYTVFVEASDGDLSQKSSNEFKVLINDKSEVLSSTRKSFNNLTIYPNPVVNGEDVHIKVNGDYAHSFTEIRLVNLKGQELFSQEIENTNQSEFIFSLNKSLNSGVYFLVMSSDSFLAINKLTIK